MNWIIVERNKRHNGEEKGQEKKVHSENIISRRKEDVRCLKKDLGTVGKSDLNNVRISCYPQKNKDISKDSSNQYADCPAETSVVMQLSQKERKRKKLTKAMRSAIIEDLGKSMDWRPGNRRRTAFGVIHNNRRQGPHTIPYIAGALLQEAMNRRQMSFRELVGTRIISYPKTAVKMLKKIGQQAVEKGNITQKEVDQKIERFEQVYRKAFQRKDYCSLFELHVFGTYCLFSEPTKENMAGKGERRGNVALDLLGSGESMIDYGNESQYSCEKIEKRYNAFRHLSQEYDELSMDTEFTDGDFEDSSVD
ncbi:MAG: hypothetical protein K2N24_10385 [Lachnospiraceae bacterium]|nr:hypothetical protein [Lachnospiraceae bacterium]